MKIYRNGKLWNSCRYPGTNCPPADCVLFMPWDPIHETKIYHWNDAGRHDDVATAGELAGR